ncbi:hypothetical protein CDAR_393531 [Caerostris darwini]|uniref:Uncharacterized protein n=1 Tax=Caerostris darwini TaxID=1538125 RepID=A0AAV4W8A4_9ARAC|nr:hypothetical protein CDAR_393531 [Caerostris darwini]
MFTHDKSTFVKGFRGKFISRFVPNMLSATQRGQKNGKDAHTRTQTDVEDVRGTVSSKRSSDFQVRVICCGSFRLRNKCLIGMTKTTRGGFV